MINVGYGCDHLRLKGRITYYKSDFCKRNKFLTSWVDDFQKRMLVETSGEWVSKHIKRSHFICWGGDAYW